MSNPCCKRRRLRRRRVETKTNCNERENVQRMSE